MSHRRTSFTAASVSITALLLAGCAPAEDDEQPGAEESPQPTQIETETETAEPSPTSEETPADEDEEDDQGPEGGNTNGGLNSGDEGSEDENAPDSEDASDDLVEEFNPDEFDTDSVDETTDDPSVVGELTEVRLGHHGKYERLVFEFTGDELPNDYQVGWTDDPTNLGTGESLDMTSEAVLALRFHVANVIDSTVERPVSIDEPLVFREGEFVQEVHFGGQYQDTADYYVGLDSDYEFRVSVDENPSRLVIDVAP